jgi:hypothetical protein
LLLGADRVDDDGWVRIRSALRWGDPRDEVADAWVAKEKVRDVYLTDDHAGENKILAHHTTGASNGPVEAANLLIKQVKRSGRGFRNLENYQLRILLAGGANPAWKTPSVASIRPRRPRLVA